MKYPISTSVITAIVLTSLTGCLSEDGGKTRSKTQNDVVREQTRLAHQVSLNATEREKKEKAIRAKNKRKREKKEKFHASLNCLIGDAEILAKAANSLEARELIKLHLPETNGRQKRDQDELMKRMGVMGIYGSGGAC